MLIDYINKSVTFTFEEMTLVQGGLNEAMRYSRMGPKDDNSSTVRYCIRCAGEDLKLAGFDRKETD